MTEISTSLLLVVFFSHDVIYSPGFSTLPGPVHDVPTWTLREDCKGHRGPLDQVPQPFSSLNSFEVTSVHNRNLAWLHPAPQTGTALLSPDLPPELSSFIYKTFQVPFCAKCHNIRFDALWLWHTLVTLRALMGFEPVWILGSRSLRFSTPHSTPILVEDLLQGFQERLASRCQLRSGSLALDSRDSYKSIVKVIILLS